MDKGTHYHKCDFQVHTPRDIRWIGSRPTSDEDRKAYADKFILACREKGLQAVAITDHHDFTFYPFIREAALREVDSTGSPIPPNQQIIIFPGLELTFTQPASCQAILILDASYPLDQLPRILTKLSITPNPDSSQSTAETIPISSDSVNGFVDLHSKLDTISGLKGRYIVLPNLSKGHGGVLRRGFYEHYQKMPSVGGYVDGKMPEDEGFLNIINGKDRNYGFKSVAVFQTSDNRQENFEKLGLHATWVKWAEPTAEALRQACLAKESRLTNRTPVLPSIYIKKIDVTNSKFLGSFSLEFNQQFNAIIGGRGTGKSTILEYLRWGLSDQSFPSGDSEQNDNVKNRRHQLIERTLSEFEGEVRVVFSVNGIDHFVKKNSTNNDIQLKISDGEFTKVHEDDIRRILPVHAYSQKQLSSVGISNAELKRFIHQPILNELSNINSSLFETSTKLKKYYHATIQKNELAKEIEQYKLQSDSFRKQIEEIKNDFKGISNQDRQIIDKKKYIEKEAELVNKSKKEIEQIHSKAIELEEYLESFELENNAEQTVVNKELISSLVSEKNVILSRVKEYVLNIKNTFDDDSLQAYHRIISAWNKQIAEFENEYTAAKAKAKENEHLVKQLEEIEMKLSVVTEYINERSFKLKDIGHPEVLFEEQFKKWFDLHSDKANMLED